jgi:hypothetical protein
MNESTQRVPEPPTEADPFQSNDWKGENRGDTIAGIVTERDTFESEKYQKTFDVLTIKNGDGEEKRVACARAHLGQLVAEHDPQPGDGIAITFFGQEAGGLTYLYGMRVAKSDSDEVPF